MLAGTVTITTAWKRVVFPSQVSPYPVVFTGRIMPNIYRNLAHNMPPVLPFGIKARTIGKDVEDTVATCA